jgi:hypothetical protein
MEEAVEDAHKRILRTAVETRDTGAATLLDLEKQRHQMEVTARARLNAPDWVRWLSDWVRWLSDWVRWLSDWVRWLSDSLLVPAARFSAPPRHPAIPSRSASKRAK